MDNLLQATSCSARRASAWFLVAQECQLRLLPAACLLYYRAGLRRRAEDLQRPYTALAQLLNCSPQEVRTATALYLLSAHCMH